MWVLFLGISHLRRFQFFFLHSKKPIFSFYFSWTFPRALVEDYARFTDLKSWGKRSQFAQDHNAGSCGRVSGWGQLSAGWASLWGCSWPTPLLTSSSVERGSKRLGEKRPGERMPGDALGWSDGRCQGILIVSLGCCRIRAWLTTADLFAPQIVTSCKGKACFTLTDASQYGTRIAGSVH